MLKPAFLILTLGVAAPFAFAQAEDDPWAEAPSSWQHAFEAEAALAWSEASDDAPVALAAAAADLNYVLQSGLKLGVAGRLEIQADHPRRAGFSGLSGFAPTGTPAPVQGAFSGLAAGNTEEDSDPRAGFERVYVYVSGGYGEARLGRDQGIAARHSVSAPSVFTAIQTGSAKLDPSGEDYVRTRHDATGPSPKLTFETPRLAGLQAGLSYTPEADGRGLDRDLSRRLPGAAALSLENTVEASLNLDRRLGESGVDIEAALGWSQSEAALGAVSGKSETWSAGVAASGESLSAGVSWLASDNGVGAARRYEAWAAGAKYTLGDWAFGLEAGAAEDQGARIESDAWRLGASRKFNDHIGVAAGWTSADTRQTGTLPPEFSPQRRDSEGFVIEITLSL